MPRLRHTPIALLLSTLFSSPSFATDAPVEDKNSDHDIVISASRVESKRVENGSSITVFDEQYLKDNQARSVAEVLQDVPGLSVASNGGLGKKTSVFIRGASSSNTVVIIDGVKVTDLSSADGGFDFANLMTDNIERIEVLRGPQSALWGSDAMGGVINIVTKKGQQGFNPTAALEIGGHGYHKENINLSGATGNNHYSLSASNIHTDGISAKNGEFDDPDHDAYKNQNVTLKAGHQFTDIFALDGVMRYSHAESEYDVNLYPIDSGINSDNNHTKKRERLAKLNTHMNLLDNRWKNRLSLAYADSVSKNYEPQGWYGPYTRNSGKNIKADLQSDYFLNNLGDFNHRFTVVAETERSTYRPWAVVEEQKMRSAAVVAEYAVDWSKTVFLTAALRRDFNSDFDDTTTHKIALTGWATDGIRLHASQGSGVKNPTFSQLFGSYATPYLNPENSDSWDIGIEYNFESINGYIDLTYFDANYDDAIRWDPNMGSYGGYVNQDEKSNGIELSSFFRVTQALRVNAAYTYMKTSDGTADDNELLRRPKHAASLNSNYKYTDNLSANIGVRYVGERLDYGNIELDDYTVINIGATYQIHQHIALSARLENAFDKDYEEISGYNSDPLTAYLGVSFK